MRPFRLSRRTVLRGLGIGLALPLLDAMLDDRGLLHGTAHAQGSRPVRLLTFMFPNGTIMPRWTPTGVGRDYAMSDCLKPLDGYILPDGTQIAAMRDDVNVVSGLANHIVLSGTATGGGHILSLGTFGTAVPMTNAGSGGVSVDQVAAQYFLGQTKFPSVPIAVQPYLNFNWDSASSAIFNNQSWAGRDQPVPAERDAQVLFNRLFADVPTTQPLVRKRRSVLDFVLEDWSNLSSKLGGTDRARVDEHLTSVRELERQLDAMAPGMCAAPSMPGTTALPGDEYARVMMRLLVTALRCDLTRFGSIQLYHNDNMYPWLGPDWAMIERHALSHQTDPVSIEMNVVATQYNVAQFSYLLWLMKNTPDGDGTLLDNALVYMCSEVSEGSVHNYDDMPILLGGRGGGVIPTGRHLVFEGAPSYARLFLTMLQLAGVPASSFGLDGTTPLSLA